MIEEIILKEFEYSILLDRFPHVYKTLEELWGSTYFHEYVTSLMVHVPTIERPSRQGFPLRALQEIYLITEAHKQRYPFLEPVERDKWR